MLKHYIHCLLGVSLLGIIAGCATPNPKYEVCSPIIADDPDCPSQPIVVTE